jgi:hypothetical protein
MRRPLPTEGLVFTRTKEGSQVSRIVSGEARVVSPMLQHADSRCQRQKCNKDTDMTHELAPSQDCVFSFGDFEDARIGNLRSGWAYVMTINDFSATMPAPVQAGFSAVTFSWSAEGINRR